jgi:hypothetical protein
MSNKAYLGDSVYADFDDYAITLTTENSGPEDPSNIIVLEPEVYGALIRWAENLKREEVK